MRRCGAGGKPLSVRYPLTAVIRSGRAAVQRKHNNDSERKLASAVAKVYVMQ